MHTHLPTCAFGEWTVTSMLDSLKEELAQDKDSTVLKLYFYAVTNAGWGELRKSVKKWISLRKARQVIAYIGTDHAVTDPAALVRMREDGVKVFMMQEYQGVFHPKVVWLEGAKNNTVWVGSNNLTRDGLRNNIEFAVLVRSKKIPASLGKWASVIASGSSSITDELLSSYESERKKFESNRAKAQATTFTWGRKREPKSKIAPKLAAGALIVEVMPKETGSEGTQLQLPLAAAHEFFGIVGVGATKKIRLRSEHTPDYHEITMTVYPNNTIRISISELEYRDRPCVIVFHKKSAILFTYEIIPQSIFPSRYKKLLKSCINRTRSGSRRWAIS